MMRSDARVLDCYGASGSSWKACTSAIISFFDEVDQNNEVFGATFKSVPTDAVDLSGSPSPATINAACAYVRDNFCPAGPDCR